MTTRAFKQRLMEGQTITFDSEKFCAETQSDDLRIAECQYTSGGFLQGFQIRFNGALFLFKTFAAFDKKLSKLKKEFNLELVD